MIAAPAARTATLTALALVAFAANSLLCRAALGAGAIDAASFTLVRVAAGALVLAMVAGGRGLGRPRAGELASPLALLAYALAFSLAYLRLSAGTGALILFGAVQVTMIAAAIRAGERPGSVGWLGIAVALGGLVWLTLPGLGAPDPLGAALMAGAGVAWGVYSLRGRGVADPLAATARNFVLATPAALVAFALALGLGVHASPRGLALAAASGALASGLGYAVWYTALRGLTATRAAVVQLCVPVLAALGGVALLGEAVGARLVASAAAILGGVALVVLRR